jgi:Cu/Ag efflux pump CusA
LLQERLAVAVPAFTAYFILLFFAFGSIKAALILQFRFQQLEAYLRFGFRACLFSISAGVDLLRLALPAFKTELC